MISTGLTSLQHFSVLRVSALVVALAVFMGCNESMTPPAEAPQRYDQLVQQAIAQAEARPDTSFFWLSNTRNAEARSLMIDLGVDYLRYDRRADVLCMWTGEGLWPARGYATAPVSGSLARDSVGRLCNIEGTCRADSASGAWVQFRCE